MDWKKNDLIQVDIEAMGSEGEGIAKVDGFPFFVKDTVPGDRAMIRIVKLKKNYGYGRLEQLLESSPDRVEPRCPVAKACGGCTMQHLDYEKQLEYKWNKVRNCLVRIGGFSDIAEKMEPVLGMEEPFHYRNKAQFPVGRNKEGKIVAGFYAGRTHSIIECDECCIQAEVNGDILKIVKAFMEEYGVQPYDEEMHAGLVRHVLTRVGDTTREIMVCLVINGTTIPHVEQLVERLLTISGMTTVCLNVNTEKTNVILGKESIVLYGDGYITDYIGELKYRISPLSFFQVNPKQTTVLYGKALEYAGLTGNETVWDLYCGIGTISLFLAQKAKKVYGVEIIPEAIDDARENARINGMENVEFFVGKAEEVFPEQYAKRGDKVKADVVCVDPPRKGCDRVLLETLLQMRPERIVYVSCDPATLARDLKMLCEKEYQVKKVAVVDQFGHSKHVETVCLLSNRKPDARVKIDVDLEDYYRIKDEQKKNKASE